MHCTVQRIGSGSVLRWRLCCHDQVDPQPLVPLHDGTACNTSCLTLFHCFDCTFAEEPLPEALVCLRHFFLVKAGMLL